VFFIGMGENSTRARQELTVGGFVAIPPDVIGTSRGPAAGPIVQVTGGPTDITFVNRRRSRKK